jgi:hypothetical protein
MANSKSNRIATAAFGAFFIGLGILTLVSADRTTRLGAAAVAVVLWLLGIDALVSAARNTRSIISRIGPLP